MPRVWNHEPTGYACPFCLLQQGVHNERNTAEDVVAVTSLAFARISPTWWPGNHGHVLVIPRAHHENLYDLPPDVGHAVWDLVQRVAVAMRSTYDCDGVSTRQHNEPGGGQDVWHLHVHVFPRYIGDRLYERQHDAREASADERKPYADRLAAALGMLRTFD
jgi:histidine triad (HIT) family protein